MNLFRVLTSGKYPLHEEHISVFLAYLLNPQMDHGLGATLLEKLVQRLNPSLQLPTLAQAITQTTPALHGDIFVNTPEPITIGIEVPSPTQTTWPHRYCGSVWKLVHCD